MPSRGDSPVARWLRLTLKELRETLRDRRTILTLVLMPLLVYPDDESRGLVRLEGTWRRGAKDGSA